MSALKEKFLIAGVASVVLAVSLVVYNGTDIAGNQDNVARASANIQKVKVQNTSEQKTKLQTLMLNSIDHYKTAKGSFEYFSESGKFHIIVDYQTDLSDSPKSYEKVRGLATENNNGITTAAEPGYEVSVYDGENLINYNSGSSDYQTNSVTKSNIPTKVVVKVGKVSEKERNYLKNASIHERITTVDGEKAYIHRIDPSYMGIAKTSLFPEDIAMGFLADDTLWDITGQENIAGVKTVVIEGKLNSEYSKRYNAKTFKLNIEPNTGIMIQMEVFDSSGTIKESIKTKNIEINKSLDTKLFKSF
ncbi:MULTISPECIES: hypothetical protein [Anoxybacillaceae]|uniref:hypothetical protein n=1 Tax=Anoxybacillaceae TaxID=3120669 RepID=UPI0005512D26|nr:MULTISPECIES: hypothetical protein [Bacillaceae]REK59700.1 MAG: hypothetical protein C6P36_01400 [Geobacillus sp.]